MASRILLTLALALSSTGITLFSDMVRAETPLSRATIQKLRNEVQLSLKAQPTRPAKQLDIMTPGDALRTFRAAMAELRFNDNSLARVGEQAQFVFVPNTRNFQLNSGTVLLLIPPGQGRTRVNTPNAAAGIRGSALFVRYIKDSNVTMVGALTNSDIEITTKTGQTVVLKAGQLGYVYKDQIGVYNFDQKTFQETSPFFKDLDWNTVAPEVKQEIDQALKEQATFAGKFNETPTWTKLSDNRAPAVTLPIAPVASAPSQIDKPDSDFYNKGTNSLPGANPGASQPQPVSPSNYQAPVLSSPATPEPAPLSVRPDPVVTPQQSAPTAQPTGPVSSVSSPPAISTPPSTVVNPSPTTPPVRPVPAPVSPSATPPITATVSTPPVTVPEQPPSPPAAAPTTPTVPVSPPIQSAPAPVAAAATPPSVVTPATPPSVPSVPTPVAAPAVPPAPTPIATPPAVTSVNSPPVVTATPPVAAPSPPPVVTPAPVLSSPSVAVPVTTLTTPTVPIAPSAPPPSIQLSPAPAPAPVATTVSTTTTAPATTTPATGSGGVQTPAANSVGGTRPLPVAAP